MIDYTLPLDRLPDPLPIEPLTKPFDVTITPPGSKSITCRAYVLAALAQGESKLTRPLRADDTDRLLEALCTLGAEARWEGDDVYIKGVGGRFPRGGSVNLGDGGTPTRFMIACACLAAEPVIVDGSKRMRERPIAEGVEMLRQLGAKIEYVEAEGRLPVRVTPSEKFVGGEIEVGQTRSSQFISALMLIAATLKYELTIRFSGEITSVGYVHLTESVMREWKLEADSELNPSYAEDDDDDPPDDLFRGSISVRAQHVVASDYWIEPDASGAVFWWTAVALIQGSAVTCPRFNRFSAQPDFGVLDALKGAVVRGAWQVDGAPQGVRVAHRGALSSILCDASAFPDGALAVSAISSACHTSSKVTGLRTLRVKETDRIAALANELRKVGCVVETGEDWIEITPPTTQKGGTGETRVPPSATPIIIETYNDHRMAMAFAVLGLAAPNGRRLAIRNPACVAKSYPTFWRDFAKLYQ